MIKCDDGGYIMERSDKEKEMKCMVDRLMVALDNVQIAMNNLREYYGVDFCSVSIDGYTHKQVQLKCGIDELAYVLNREVKMNTTWRAEKNFRYEWVKFLQLAEQNSMNFLPLNYRGKAMRSLECDWEEQYEKE